MRVFEGELRWAKKFRIACHASIGAAFTLVNPVNGAECSAALA